MQKVVEPRRPCVVNGSGHQCLDGLQYCAFDVDPPNGIISFDNMGISMLAVIQMLTMEG